MDNNIILKIFQLNYKYNNLEHKIENELIHLIIKYKLHIFIINVLHSVKVGTKGSNPSSSTGITNSANFPS